jgi:hypothetical protein
MTVCPALLCALSYTSSIPLASSPLHGFLCAVVINPTANGFVPSLRTARRSRLEYVTVSYIIYLWLGCNIPQGSNLTLISELTRDSAHNRILKARCSSVEVSDCLRAGRPSGQGSSPARERIFSSAYRPDRLWGPPSLLSSGHRELFPRI